MKRNEKRWAWTARQRRPKRKHWNSRPDDTRWYHHLSERKHRSQTRQGLILIRQGADEGHVVFPYHHHHWLTWWWT
ncbi:hypothetical protein [Hymenobacter sp. AT01-02]|uniref:hypothetical protein n=1 Tax=Hymenobacter sp. AT01-02 TaxID=1571877 RepID=UPI0005F1870C|nr:hypothetical protein [Hymenobacter sp. AT01-02]